MTPPGRVVRGIRRAFYNPSRELTTRELWNLDASSRGALP